jgi:hypothetical protein
VNRFIYACIVLINILFTVPALFCRVFLFLGTLRNSLDSVKFVKHSGKLNNPEDLDAYIQQTRQELRFIFV